MQVKSTLATLLLSVLIGITIAASDRGNVRSLNLSARHINGERALLVETAGKKGVDEEPEETEDDDGTVDDENDNAEADAEDDESSVKTTKRLGNNSNSTSAPSAYKGKGGKESSKYNGGPSKKSKKLSSKDDSRLKMSKREFSPTHTPGSPTQGSPTHSPDASPSSPTHSPDASPSSPTHSPDASPSIPTHSPDASPTDAGHPNDSPTTNPDSSSPITPTDSPVGTEDDAPAASPDGTEAEDGAVDDDDAVDDGDGTDAGSQTDGASAEAVEVPADAFTLYYTTSESRLPSTEEFQELAQITSTYLEEYMRGAFGEGLEIFSTFMIFQEFRIDQPARCDYRSVGTFKGDFEDIPTTANLNNLIASAFSGPNLQDYLARFDSLPDGNLFQTTTEVGQEAEAQSDSSSSGGAAAAGVGAILLVAGAAHVARRKKNQQEGESDTDNADKLNSEGSDAGTVGAAEGDESTAGAPQ